MQRSEIRGWLLLRTKTRIALRSIRQLATCLAYFGCLDCRNYEGWEAKMNRQRGPRAAVLPVAAIALLSLAPAASAPLLPRNTVVPVSVVTQYFPDVTKEASTGSNETSVGRPIASRSVVFASADGKKKVTLSVDQYASVSDAAAAYQTAVKGSKIAPGFKPAATPKLGQEAFAGTSQVGAEMHFGLGARDGR